MGVFVVHVVVFVVLLVVLVDDTVDIVVAVAIAVGPRNLYLKFGQCNCDTLFLGTTAQLTHRFCACFLVTQFPHFPNYNISYERSQEY